MQSNFLLFRDVRKLGGAYRVCVEYSSWPGSVRFQKVSDEILYYIRTKIEEFLRKEFGNRDKCKQNYPRKGEKNF